MHSQLLPILRILSDSRFHTGAEIARELGTSSATVSNALQTTDMLGISIYKVRGRGYRLPSPPEWLQSHQVHNLLHPAANNVYVDIQDCTDSTNSALLQDSSRHQHCMAVEHQLSGRGRRGRQWLSPLGGSLTCSLRWHFQHGMAALSGLSLAVGVVVLRTLHQFSITDAQMKWPNDVLWHNKKLAGILIEVQGDAHDSSVAVMGIGLNVHLPTDIRQQIDQSVTDLREIVGHSISRNALLASLINHWVNVLHEFEQHGLLHLSEEWNAAHAYHQQEVTVTLANQESLRGIATGINGHGALLLKQTNGETITVHSGEVHHTRPSTQNVSVTGT